MRVLVAADMEGVTGVVSWDHVSSKHPEYARFRGLMTADVNAAVAGACEGGASEVTVADGHGNGRNVLIDTLDPRARLNCGSPSPFSMVQGIDSGVDLAFFVGYHARASVADAILCHTWAGGVRNVWLNGQAVGEIGLNAAVCGHFGVPVAMISGDQTACAEAAALLGQVETAVVKEACGRMAAGCLPPAVAQARIRAASQRAVERALSGGGPAAWQVGSPVRIAVEFLSVESTERAAILPGTSRPESTRIEFSAPDMPDAYRMFRVAMAVSAQ